MKLCTVEIRYITKIIAGEQRVEKNTKKKEKYCRKTIENAEKPGLPADRSDKTDPDDHSAQADGRTCAAVPDAV